MTKLDPVEVLASSAPRLSEETKQAHLALLRAEIHTSEPHAPQSNTRRGRGWRGRATALTTAGLVVLGVGTAAAYVQFMKPSVTDVARCFAVSDPADFEDFDKAGGAFHDIAALTPEGDSWTSDQTATHALEACANAWRTGGLSSTPPHLRDLDPWYVDFTGPKPAEHPVPGLVACVLDAGIVGVFPDTTCAALRLPTADLARE
jgi:hypothetical protein